MILYNVVEEILLVGEVNLVLMYCSLFIFYSVLGWAYESLLCSFIEKRWINRGFLNGPYCPIYGFGALLDIICLGRLSNPFEIFFWGALLNCTLEYLTSYAMEKMFNARWWDYSDKFLNINGRVCLIGATVFGAFCVALVTIVNPVVVRYIKTIPDFTLNIAVILFLVVYATDNIITFIAVAQLDEKLRELKEILEEKRENAIKTVNLYKEEAIGKFRNRIPEPRIHKAFIKALGFQNKRIIKAFPRLRSTKYNEVLTELREFMNKRK